MNNFDLSQTVAPQPIPLKADEQFALFEAACRSVTGCTHTEAARGDHCARAASLFLGLPDAATSAPVNKCMHIDRQDGIPVELRDKYSALRSPHSDTSCILALLADATNAEPSREKTEMTGRPQPTDSYLIDFRERSLDQVLEEVERRTILNALERTEGQRNKAAKLMRISRSRLYRRLEALNINQNHTP